MSRYASFLLMAVLAGPAAAGAQDAAPPLPSLSRFSVAVRMGPAMPTGEFRDDGVRPGYVASLEANLHAGPSVSFYAGVSDARYTPSDPLEFLFDDTTIEVLGFETGARVNLLPSARLSPWLGGGVVYKEIWVDGGGALGYTSDSHHSLGWEVASGGSYRVTRRIHLTPALRYQLLSPRQAVDSWSVTDANQLLMDVGIAYRF